MRHSFEQFYFICEESIELPEPNFQYKFKQCDIEPVRLSLTKLLLSLLNSVDFCALSIFHHSKYQSFIFDELVAFSHLFYKIKNTKILLQSLDRLRRERYARCAIAHTRLFRL